MPQLAVRSSQKQEIAYVHLELVQFFRAVFANVILVVVHADDTSVHREQGSIQAFGHSAVEVLALLLGHREDHCGWVADLTLLHTWFSCLMFIGAAQFPMTKGHIMPLSHAPVIKCSIISYI